MPAAYRFGRCEVRPTGRQLLIDGQPAALGARAFDLLLALIERRDRVVGKNEILDLVWPGLVVEENNLQVQISAMRKLLGPNAIATIPGRGYQFALPLDGSEPAAPAAASARRADESVLFGRAAELAELRAAVAANPLVTVLGPGGIGKTRLVEVLLRDLRAEFAEGSWKVDLASLADPELVASTVAQTIGARAGDPARAPALIVEALAQRRALLVLDNCEHLLDAVDRLVAALRTGAPHVRIVLTSQELLKHPDEQVYRLGPLALPAADGVTNAIQSGAIALFVARARAVAPRFELAEDNVAAVVDICRRLDGIPLAIELAAARVPLLGINGVREKLDERFRLLTGGARLALRRHQTLRAALEWSYSLLAPAEQRVFDRLAVFAGGFTLKMAQALASDDAIDEWAVLEHLGALVDKSLVVVDQGAEPRYRMLETTRAYGLERAAARGETQALLRRHAAVVLQVFEDNYADNRRGLLPHEQVGRMFPELDNLRAALRWADADGADPPLAIALVGAAGAGRGFLGSAGIQWEGQTWCKSLRPKVDPAVPAAHAARFWLTCAELGVAGSLDEAVRDAQRAVDLFRAAHDRLGTYFALHALCYTSLSSGRRAQARQTLDAAQRLLDPAWPPRIRATFENLAALCFMESGESTRARAHLEEYLRLSRQLGSTLDAETALALLVDLDVQTGYVDRAAEAARVLLADRGLVVDFDDGLTHRDAATALMLAGALDEAEAAYRAALPLARRAHGTSAFVLDDAAALLARRGRLEDAARIAGYADRVSVERSRNARAVGRQLREQLLAQLQAALPAGRLEQLFEEGRRLTDEQACALAFPPAR